MKNLNFFLIHRSREYSGNYQAGGERSREMLVKGYKFPSFSQTGGGSSVNLLYSMLIIVNNASCT
jgi:hypothetical protein